MNKSDMGNDNNAEKEFWFGKYIIGGLCVSVIMVFNFMVLKEDYYFLFSDSFFDTILNIPTYLKENHPKNYNLSILSFYVLILEKGFHDYKEGLGINLGVFASLMDALILFIALTILILFVF
tara:strand:+ start:139 stop:504 length:366 start_codon:yes stop_codon:yes gene_type:complete